MRELIAMRATYLAITLAAASCTADRPESHEPDAGTTTEALTAPSIDPSVPVSTPNDTIAIRGSTGGTRVLVKGGPGEPVVNSVLPTGGYCLDVPLAASGPTILYVIALKDGDISGATPITITRDPSAPAPASPRCNDVEQPTCGVESAATSDSCTDGKDNDCNGYVDACDPNCNGCKEDAFGPNWDPFFVPMITAGKYPLEICPCRSDWFAFDVAVGDVIHATITFDPTKIDLDLLLQVPADAEAGATTAVATSRGTTGTEDINWTATAAGIYYLRVFAFSGDTASYSLTVN
ncbi:MAG TPA: PPC domain-containing protein [Kofleriaceae bacterium]|nr:PPC domain-containing protein [Kofleriaceae bacterium]